MTTQPEALFLADELEAPLGTVISGEVDRRAAAELRRLHAEVEHLKKTCYDYLGEVSALRAADQMRKRIDAQKKVAIWPFPPPGGPVPLTPKELKELERKEREKLPEAPF